VGSICSSQRLNLVFAASPVSTQHYEVKSKPSSEESGKVCHNGARFLQNYLIDLA
jgi:hypothetical protein